MHNAIVSDSSCFIILEKISRLDLLRLSYETVFTTSEVAREFGLPLPTWVIVQDPTDTKGVIEIRSKVDAGEASAISLALEIGNVSLILDDQKARRLAESLGIDVTGTIGVAIRAKLSGRIDSIKPILAEMRATNFRFSPEIERKALEQAGE